MESSVATAARSRAAGSKPDDTVLESLRLGEEIQSLMAAPPESGSSFTALLGLPPTQAMELLHSPGPSPAQISGQAVPLINHRKAHFYQLEVNMTFPSNTALIERAAKFSVFAGENNSPDTSSAPSNSGASLDQVKNEPTDTDSKPISSQQQLVSQPACENNSPRAAKRKEPEKKGKGSAKKSKHEISEETEKLPYVHVRARRGQATDSHSLAERARREKINARMKLLQELVPGCNKISGTALVLDEIINHVQSLQHQVEFLSMRLAAVDPRTNINLDSILAAESGSLMDSNIPGIVMPLLWPEIQVNRSRQQYQQQQWHVDAVQQQPVWVREDDNHNFIASENSLLSYDSSANSVALHSNHLKMEL